MTKTNLKLILIAVLVATAVSIGSYFILLLRSDVAKTDINIAEKTDINEEDIKVALERPDDQLFGWQYPVAMLPEVGPTGEKLAYSTVRDPGGIPQGLPVRLKIPAISVNSAIEDALITPDGRMDVPYGSVNVAWFSLGPKPGLEGSAVIGGHFGINDGKKFVFYDLDKLVVGDKIYIEDDKGATLAFQVRRIELLERDADATDVFTSTDGLAHLNLITCEGIWNRVNDTYPSRRVVFTDAVTDEGAAVVEPIIPSTATTFRALSIGARGEDVIKLQTMLVEKGLLVIPRGVSKGYFGALTRVAVAKYQVSVGLSSTGIFESTTRAKLIPATATAKEPITPATAIAPRSLSIGARGADVTELQTMLVEKGLLVIPRGVSKGYFGSLTRSAVTRYQTSIGLPATGIFDSLTKDKLVPEVEVAKQPTLPSTAMIPESSTTIVPKSQSSPNVIIGHIQSLYATPTDALVTSILLVVIIFTAFYTIFYTIKNRFKKKVKHKRH